MTHRPCVLCGEPRLPERTTCAACAASIQHDHADVVTEACRRARMTAARIRRVMEYHDREKQLAAPTAS